MIDDDPMRLLLSARANTALVHPNNRNMRPTRLADAMHAEMSRYTGIDWLLFVSSIDNTLHRVASDVCDNAVGFLE